MLETLYERTKRQPIHLTTLRPQGRHFGVHGTLVGLLCAWRFIPQVTDRSASRRRAAKNNRAGTVPYLLRPHDPLYYKGQGNE